MTASTPSIRDAIRARMWLPLILVIALLASVDAASTKSPLQSSLDKLVAGQATAAIVVNARTGTVLATHNVPVLTRRVAAPGSVIKPFVLQLLLDSGAIRPQDSIVCRRHLTIAGRSLHCSHPPELASFQAADALAYSCNSYFVTAAGRLKPGELERRFKELGFTRPSGLLPNEGQGHVDAAKDVAARQLLSIGVSGIEITPAELAAAYLRLARIDPTSASPSEKLVLDGLKRATDYGLAQNAKLEGTSVAGKTGTASDPADPHTHAWFAGFAPADKPEIVVVVFVERGRGSVEAANLAHKIFAAYEEPK